MINTAVRCCAILCHGLLKPLVLQLVRLLSAFRLSADPLHPTVAKSRLVYRSYALYHRVSGPGWPLPKTPKVLAGARP